MTNTINAETYVAFDLAKEIAVEYKNETAVSERKMADKYNVPRSRIQKIKKEVLNGDWDEILTVKEIETETHNVKQTKVKLSTKTHQKAPTKKSLVIFESVQGDFDKFVLAILETNPTITDAYINSQFYRCVNHK